MDRRQAFFLEGIRFSIEMIDVTHQRLQNVLRHISERSHAGEKLTPEPFACVLQDAWSVIDSVHRLRGLLNHIPGISKRMRIPAIRYFFQDSAVVEVFRNTIQHLPEEIRNEPLDPTWSVWGNLSWCWV